MSLEQAVQENTATLKQLIAVLSTIAEDGGSLAPAGSGAADTGEAGEKKRTRRTKAQIEADAAAAAAAATTSAPAGVNMNTTGAPIYMIVDSNKTCGVIEPGNVIPSIPGARQVTKEEYEAYKAQAAAATAAVVNQQAAAPVATAPAATTAAPVDFASITNRLVKIHGKGGNEGVMKVLSAFGAANVPALAQADLNSVAAKVLEVEVSLGLAEAPAATAANLFG